MNRKSTTKPKGNNVLRESSGIGHFKYGSTKSTIGSSNEKKRPNHIVRPAAPVKKIPNVHSSAPRPGQGGGGADPQVMRQQLLQERQRNKILQLEVERLRKSLEICKKTVQEKSIEIEHKNKLINKLIEDKTRIESTQDIVEDDIDIDNLLHANLGEVDINDILNFNDSVFPDDLDNLDITNLMPDQSLCLSPASLNMATNTSYVVEEQSVQIPNREGSIEEETVEVKGVVGRMVEQRRSILSTPQEKINCRKVSPIKILRGGNKYQLVSKKRSAADSPPEVPPCKLPKSSGKVIPTAPQCLSCPHCNKKFPLGGQWALTRHISSVHCSNSNTTYSCQYCDKEFSYQSVLIAHMKWHEMTNPWQCGKCDYKLDSLEKFVKHMKRVHVVKTLTSAKTLLVSTILIHKIA